MKLVQPFVSLLLVVAILAFSYLGPSCVGPDVVEGAQFPAAQLAWPGVEGDYLRGIADGTSEGDLTMQAADELRAECDTMRAALLAKDPDALRLVPWSTIMRPWADRGIADKLGDGEVGPTVAEELTERVSNFTATIESLQGVR